MNELVRVCIKSQPIWSLLNKKRNDYRTRVQACFV